MNEAAFNNNVKMFLMRLISFTLLKYPFYRRVYANPDFRSQTLILDTTRLMWSTSTVSYVSVR